MNTNPPLVTERTNPRWGEVWDVNFDPTVESEIQKVRSVVVISSDSIGHLPIKWVFPITDWEDQFSGSIWHVLIKPNDINGLKQVSAVDTLQICMVDVIRFLSRRGGLNATLMQEITAAIAAIIEYE